MEVKKSNILVFIILLIMAIAIVATLMWGLGEGKENINTPQIEEASRLTGSKYVEETVKGLRVNTSNKIKETKILDGIEIKIEQLTALNNYTTILGTLKNTTDKKIHESDIILIVYDDKGNELAKENIGKVIPTLAENQEIDLNISIINDYANAYDLKFERTNGDT